MTCCAINLPDGLGNGTPATHEDSIRYPCSSRRAFPRFSFVALAMGRAFRLLRRHIVPSNCCYDEKKVALCGIEEAYNQGEISFKKPVSCHLYPVRIKQYSEFAAVNYDRWEICDDACSLGKELSVPVFKFVKQALVRKFGEQWYEELEHVAEERSRSNKS